MRLWSLHPKYLDYQTLVDLWRDCVRASRLIRDGKIEKHPQLVRFEYKPALSDYMHVIVDVARKRGWNSKRWLFDRKYIPLPISSTYPLPYAIPVTAGQMELEAWHYAEILVKARGGGQAYVDFWSIREHQPHPLFTLVPGAIEAWEKLSHDGYTQCAACGGPIYYHGRGQPPKLCEGFRPK